MTSNSELRERRASAVPRGIASMMGVFADRAENAEIWDVDGRRYVDFASPAASPCSTLATAIPR
jgi:4-aminobutyrate aminotransferase/(S)-3-amino-2-methylpropionate transaminase